MAYRYQTKYYILQEKIENLSKNTPHGIKADENKQVPLGELKQ